MRTFRFSVSFLCLIVGCGLSNLLGAQGSAAGKAKGQTTLFTFPASVPAPTTPGTPYVIDADATLLTLVWPASEAAAGRTIVRYEVFLNGQKIGQTAVPENNWATVDYHPAGNFWEFFAVRAVDNRGAVSTLSPELLAPHDGDVSAGTGVSVDFKQSQGSAQKFGFKGLITGKFYREIGYVERRTETGFSDGVPASTYDNQVIITSVAGGATTVTGQMVSTERPDLFYPSGLWSLSTFGYPPRAVLRLGVTTISSLIVPDDSNRPTINDPAMTDVSARQETTTTGADPYYPFNLSRTRTTYLLKHLTLNDEFTDAQLLAQVQAGYNEAVGIAAGIDWGTYAFSDGRGNSGVGYYEGGPEFLAQRYEERRQGVLSSLSTMGAVYRLRPSDPAAAQVRWAEVFYPDDGGSSQVLAIRTAQPSASPEGVLTGEFSLAVPVALGGVKVQVVGTALQVSIPGAGVADATGPRLYERNALFVGSAADFSLSYADPAFISAVSVVVSGDALRLVALDPEVEYWLGEEAAIAAGQIVASGTNLWAMPNRPGVGGWRLVAVGATPGTATVTISITAGGVTWTEIRALTVYPAIGIAVDASRDGVIRLAGEDSSDATTVAAPFRFWINDDDDQGPADGDDIPGRALNRADNNNAVVDSVRDLVDFFPVFLDVKQFLTVLPPSDSIRYRLKQADGALNFVYTNKNKAEAFDYQKQILATGFGPDFTQAAGVSTTQQITAGGVELDTAFLVGIKNTGWGVLLLEGRVASDKPLVLVVEKDGMRIAEVAVNIKISPVEQMFRHVNLTSVPSEYESGIPSIPEPAEATRTGAPLNWPDTQTNGKYFVFLHGYNVDAQKARGWQAEVFKRLHVLGSKTRFVGVTWHGATGLDYHKAVYHAFQTGDSIAGELSFTGSADVTIAGHSLGNMVLSHAIQAGGLTPARYYIINGATPLEAYALGDAGPGEAANMTELAWREYDPRLYMANWHTLFTSADNRSALTWKNLFASVRTRTEAHNFYSEEEEVVADADENTSASVMATLLNQGFDVSLGAWKAQELVKGVNWSTSLVSLFMKRGQAGWGFNSDWYKQRGKTNSGPIMSLRFPFETSEAEVPTADLKTKPFFKDFLEPSIISANVSSTSGKAGETKVKYDLLARGIPAMSNATAANVMPSLTGERNFPMHSAGKVAANGPFPTNARGDWRHSDFKAVGLPYVYPMYQAMIDRGGFNQ
jgi:hypothetical protein